MLSAVMMLRHLDENTAADKLENAILKLLTEAKVLTGDLGGNSTTIDVTNEIINLLD